MAFIIAGLVFLFTFLFALFSELARGQASAPSMHPTKFWSIMIPGTILALMVAGSHWLPRISW